MEEDAAVAGSPNSLTARRSTAARSADNELTSQAARSANNQLKESIATFSTETTTRRQRGGTTGQVSSGLAQMGGVVGCKRIGSLLANTSKRGVLMDRAELERRLSAERTAVFM